ncbi:glycoside hydrolase family 105 protein [Paraglaciecola sp. L3A3]|uniref:glycoside hydrolase family 88/105 protein n=1 Tax=Paraglaciecola sp. L3A3 TaxID=2686358 RepID=UPI00131AD9C9|nr:glycoside hydrolase family 88 protein [Paraglaciecola sp. L3A3]
MKRFITPLVLILTLVSSTSCSAETNTSENIDKESIYASMKKVIDWQLLHYNKQKREFETDDKKAYIALGEGDSDPLGWVYASFHIGMDRWSKLADSKGDSQYLKLQYDYAKHYNYLLGPRIYNADDYAIGQLYLDLYEKYKEPEMLVPLKVIFDTILQSPSTVGLEIEVIDQVSKISGQIIKDSYAGLASTLVPAKNRWSWADAIFMGPPVWIHLAKITGDDKYLEFADKEFWQTVNLLWDEDDQLFYRDSRFFDRREENGQKVIWARGVGWVAAGLARILEHLPEDHAKRAKYEDIFVKLMTRLAGAQQSDGLWRPSVLAPESQPYRETSGTALMAYGYAFGINNGLLDKEKFQPVVDKAWLALVDSIQDSGKLGWVQQIGYKPESVTEDDTQIFAIGAFLLTGSEMYKLANK